MISYMGLLKIKEGKREEYLQELLKSKMIETFREQTGNVYYTVGKSITDEDMVIVSDGWMDMKTFHDHDTCGVVEDTWGPLAEKYVVEETSYLLNQIEE